MFAQAFRNIDDVLYFDPSLLPERQVASLEGWNPGNHMKWLSHISHYSSHSLFSNREY